MFFKYAIIINFFKNFMIKRKVVDIKLIESYIGICVKIKINNFQKWKNTNKEICDKNKQKQRLSLSEMTLKQ